MRIGLGLLTAVVLGALLTAGCGGGNGGSDLPDPTIRFVNSSPDSNPQDFYIDTTKKASAIAYATSSAEVTNDNGDRDITVKDPTATPDTLDAITFTLEKDKQYIALTLGLQNFLTENAKRLRLISFSYNKNAPNGNTARLLIEHGFMRSAGFDTPTIDFQNPGENPQFKLAGIPFAAGAPGELEVDAGVPLTFQARRADTENVYASSTDTFLPGKIYLALVTGVEGAVGAQAPQIKYILLN
jgi:hypothetical protein